MGSTANVQKMNDLVVPERKSERGFRIPVDGEMFGCSIEMLSISFQYFLWRIKIRDTKQELVKGNNHKEVQGENFNSYDEIK